MICFVSLYLSNSNYIYIYRKKFLFFIEKSYLRVLDVIGKLLVLMVPGRHKTSLASCIAAIGKIGEHHCFPVI